jgi:hypothetical protein
MNTALKAKLASFTSSFIKSLLDEAYRDAAARQAPVFFTLLVSNYEGRKSSETAVWKLWNCILHLR